MPVSFIVGFSVLFSAMVAVAIAKKTGGMDYDLAKRAVGMIFGLMLVCSGNLVPKLRLFHSSKVDPSRSQAAERSAGWIFVGGGFAYFLAWALTPGADAMLVSSVIGLSAFALVALCWLRLPTTSTASSTDSLYSENSISRKLLLGSILVSLGWGVGIILSDYLWGDVVAKWLGVSFAILFPVIFLTWAPHWLQSRVPAKR